MIETFEMRIPQLNVKRTIRVYLPLSYNEQSSSRYPVLYMQDGQNLFDDNTAYGGQSWGVRKTLEEFEKNNKLKGVIVVGVDNGCNERRNEYLPWVSKTAEMYFGIKEKVGGKGDAFADFFAKDLKSYIDKKYRTLSEKENTAIAGSSMGALISVYISAKYPDVYGTIGAFSTASYLAEKEFLEYLKKNVTDNNQKYYISVGTKETSNDSFKEFPTVYLNCSENLNEVLRFKGIPSKNIFYVIGENEIHNEKCWADRFPQFVEWSYCDKAGS